MQEGPVDLGIVHLGDQVVVGELHVHHRGRHVLLEIVLAVDRPLEAAELRGTEVGVLQRVESSRHGLVEQAAVVHLSPVPRPPHRHEVRRDGELEMPLKLATVIESAVAAHVGEYVGVPVVDHGAWRGLPDSGRGQYIPQGALDLATAIAALPGDLYLCHPHTCTLRATTTGRARMKLYTRSGDDGTTGLLFGGRASKAGPRTEAYGAIDTAISAMGMARALSSDKRVKDILLRCQHDMFTAATEVAVDPDHYDLLIENFSPVTEGMVERLEGWIDALDDEVDLPPRFIVPGASASSGAIDLARTLTRDAERRIVALSETEPPKNDNVLRYVNRLSDLLFILARYEDRDLPFEITTGEMRRDAEQ